MFRFVMFVFLVFSPSLHGAQLNSILVVGDSLSAAYGIDVKTGWVSLLQQKLLDENKNYHVINASISGDTTVSGRHRLQPLLDRYRPAIVIIELGGNDGLRGLSLSQMKKNLQFMIGASQAAQAKVLLTGIKIPPNYGERYTDAFYRIYTELAKQDSVSFVPFLLDGIADRGEFMQADRIHPNTKAQALIMQHVWLVLSQQL